MHRAAALSVMVISSLVAGCLESSSTADTVVYPTMLTVDPASFRGTLGCGAAGLQRYVVTLTDVTGGDAAATVPGSSSPAACARPTSFSLDTSVGHAFVGEIDGYDRADIAPVGAGRREMVDVSTGQPVCPRWRATCGETPGSGQAPNPLRAPTVVVGLAETFLTGCTALAASEPGCAHMEGEDAGAEASPLDSAAEARSDDGSTADATLPLLDASFDAHVDASRDAQASDAAVSAEAAALLEAASDALDDAPIQVPSDGSREGG